MSVCLRKLVLFLSTLLCSAISGANPADPIQIPARAMLTPETFATIDQSTPFYCLGADPEWSLEVNDNVFRYVEFNNQETLLQVKKPRVASPVGGDRVHVYETTTLANGRPVNFIIRHNYFGCSIGRPSDAFEYSVTIVFNNKLRVGCCNAIVF